jgi:hypothetical protein
MSDPITRLNEALGGRYTIAHRLGEGGMATVYLADDLKHDRKVALKVLKPELAAVVGGERFLAEIKTTANLQHPHILPLFDSGEADSFLFYVMPYVEGESLRERLDRERQLPVDEAVRIATDVAEALHSAHERGVIHRDIKPANILMSEGRPLVADFGIALAVSAAGGGRLTETGLSMGTPYYMSPEQASADREPTAASDVYSLGCVLYEMLVGEPPYTGTSAQAVLAKILMGDAPAATATRSSIPTHVDAAIRKALEKLPADRFRTASAFVAALGDKGFRHGHVADPTAGGAPVPAASHSPWNRLTIGFAGLAVVFALVAAWSLARPEPEQRVVRQVLSTDGWAGLSVEVGRFAALAPNGASMILPLDGQLGLKLAGSSDVTPIPDTEGARDVVYSPDGEWIAYAVGNEIFKRPLTGGAPIRLAQDAEGGENRVAMAWLDDGTLFYEAAGGRFVQIPDIGGTPLREITGTTTLFWMSALPDGRGALVVSSGQELGVVDLGDGTETPLLTDVVRAWYAPTGHVIYVRVDGAVFAQPFDLGTMALSGGAIPLLDGVRTTAVRADMRLAPDGTVLYVEGGSEAGAGDRLAIQDLEGDQAPLPLGPRAFTRARPGPGWSPDGESVVFETEGQIYTYNTVLNTTPRQITFEGVNFSPVYSPDGTRVVFSSLRSGTDGLDLFVKDLTDDAPPRSLIVLNASQATMGWPTDTLLVFEQGEGGAQDLWTLDLSDPDEPEARPYLTSEADLRYVAVSPDGRHAAYSSNESGAPEIYIRSFPDPGGQTVVSQGGGQFPFWSPDGNTLYYYTGTGGPWIAADLQRGPVLSVVALDTLFANPTLAAQPVPTSFHPDGDRWIVAVPASVPQNGDAPGQRLILVQNFFEELRRLTGN